MHPIGIFASEAMKNVIDYRLFGPAEGRSDFGAAKQDELKKKFGAMINASPARSPTPLTPPTAKTSSSWASIWRR
jgi:hypothetical protein